MPLLNPGDPFPRLAITTTGDQSLTLPDAFAGNFAVVLFYRGAWCPYCNAQLRAFERASQALADAGILVVALSADDNETTATLVAKHKLTFPVGYGADAPAIAALTGAFVNPDPVYLQSTGFVLDPAGNVVVSVYSSGAIGRLVPDDVAGLVRYLHEHSPGGTARAAASHSAGLSFRGGQQPADAIGVRDHMMDGRGTGKPGICRHERLSSCRMGRGGQDRVERAKARSFLEEAQSFAQVSFLDDKQRREQFYAAGLGADVDG